jgi:hypothetical protein
LIRLSACGGRHIRAGPPVLPQNVKRLANTGRIREAFVSSAEKIGPAIVRRTSDI